MRPREDVKLDNMSTAYADGEYKDATGCDRPSPLNKFKLVFSYFKLRMAYKAGWRDGKDDVWHTGMPPRNHPFMVLIKDYGPAPGGFDTEGRPCYLKDGELVPLKGLHYRWSEMPEVVW